jgi:3D (Asp-Asp-Asp) domain-containing protein
MNLRELRNATIVFVLGMFYHKYVSYMMDLAKTMSKKEMVSEALVCESTEPIKDEVKQIKTETKKHKSKKKRKIVKLHVTATMYYPVVKQCDKDPLVTAGMFKINPRKASEHKWIAMSRNLLKRWKGDFDYGDIVEIKGAGKKSGVYKVVDTMNKRYKDRIDILETEGTSFYKFEDIQIAKL